jgi:hypothetical protein
MNFSNVGGLSVVHGCTVYGREAKVGNGLNLSGTTSPHDRITSNIFYGLTTGILVSTVAQGTNLGSKNNFFNNTTDATLYTKEPDALALNPNFTSASQLTGTTATTSGSVLTDSGASFTGVTDSVDYLHVVSGTGVTVGCYLINSHTSTTLTVNNALGTSSGGDVVYWVTNGHNFAIGTNLQAKGVPGVFQAGLTTAYQDVGAVQHQGTASSNTGFFIQ